MVSLTFAVHSSNLVPLKELRLQGNQKSANCRYLTWQCRDNMLIVLVTWDTCLLAIDSCCQNMLGHESRYIGVDVNVTLDPKLILTLKMQLG